jgi:hypothetical protein
MKIMNSIGLALLLFSGVAAVSHAAPGPDWAPLFNGKDLSEWETFLRPSGKNGPDYGLNRDPEKVFRLENESGEPVIHISGKYPGGVITRKEFENYHLRLEFKWGNNSARRSKLPPDSGLLYHCAAPLPEARYPWGRSIEFNITQHDTGEFWSVETIADAEVVPIGTSPEELAAFKGWCERNEATGPKLKFKKGGIRQSFPDGGFMPADDFEKPAGEWNLLELYAVGDRSVHVVNGQVAVVLTGLRYKLNNREVPLTKGRIELQSEGAEIFFRRLQIRPIQQIPPELLK